MLIKHTRNTAGSGEGTHGASNSTHSVPALHARTSERRRRRGFRAKEEQIAPFFNTSGHEKSLSNQQR